VWVVGDREGGHDRWQHPCRPDRHLPVALVVILLLLLPLLLLLFVSCRFVS